MVYVLQNRKGKNFFRWIKLVLTLNNVLFHDVQKEIDSGKRLVYLLPFTYLINKPIDTKGATLRGAGPKTTVFKEVGEEFPIK